MRNFDALKKILCLPKSVKWEIFTHSKKNIMLTEVSKMRIFHSLKKKILTSKFHRETEVSENFRKASPFWLKNTNIQLFYNFKRWHLVCHLGVIRWHLHLKGYTLIFCLQILIFIGQQYFYLLKSVTWEFSLSPKKIIDIKIYWYQNFIGRQRWVKISEKRHLFD